MARGDKLQEWIKLNGAWNKGKKGLQVLRLWEHEIRIMDVNQFSNKLKGGTR